jgi:hypothetical protein
MPAECADEEGQKMLALLVKHGVAKLVGWRKEDWKDELY